MIQRRPIPILKDMDRLFHRTLVFLIIVLLSPPVLSQEREIAIVERVAPHLPVEIDGDTREWALRELPADRILTLSRQDQLLPGREARWSGPGDLSARFILAYDDDNLFIVGLIRDDSLTNENPPMWWQGDSIEFFLDTRIDEPEGSDPPSLFSDDDYQIFLMPLNPRRPWGIWQQGGIIEQSSSRFEGVKVAWTTMEGGYQFEAKIPLVHFKHLETTPGTEIGLNLAINDIDGEQDGDNEHAYIMWSGREPPVQSPANFGRVRFRDPHNTPPQTVTRSWDEEKDLALTLGLIAALMVLGLAVSRLAPRLARLSSRTRIIALSSLGALLLLSGLIPALLTHRQKLQARLMFSKRLDTLEEVLLEVRSEQLINPDSSRNSEDLTQLLLGEPVQLAPVHRYQTVALQEKDEPSLSQTHQGIPYYDRRNSEAEFNQPGEKRVFHLGLDPGIEELALIYTIPVHPGMTSPGPGPQERMNRSGRVVGHFEIHYARGAPDQIPIELGHNADWGISRDPRHLGSNWSPQVQVAASRQILPTLDDPIYEHWDQLLIPIPEEKRNVPIHRLTYRHASATIPFSLTAVTALPADSEAPIPVVLSRPTLTGVPVALHAWTTNPGSLPRTTPSGPLEFAIDQPAETMWFVYTSDRRDNELPRTGAEVGSFLITDQEGERLEVPLVYRENVDDQLLVGLDQSLKSEAVDLAWVVPRTGVRFLILTLPLGKMRNLETLSVLDNDAGCAIQLAAVVLGMEREKDEDRYQSLSHMIPQGNGSFSLSPETKASLSDLSLEINKDPSLLASLSSAPESRFREDEDGAAPTLRAVLPIYPQQRPELILTVEQTQPPVESSKPGWNIVRLCLLALILPLGLIALTDLLDRARRLRLKLVMAFILVSILPLGVLFFVLNGLTRTRLEFEASQKTRTLLTSLQDSVEQHKRRVQETAAQMLIQCKDQIFADLDEINAETRIDPMLWAENLDSREIEEFLRRQREQYFPNQSRAYVVLTHIAQEEGRGTLADPTRAYRETTFTSPPPKEGFSAFGHASVSPGGLHFDAGDLLFIGSQTNRTPGGTSWQELRLVCPLDLGLLRDMASAPSREAEVFFYSRRGVPILETLKDPKAGFAKEGIQRTRDTISDILVTGRPHRSQRTMNGTSHEVHFDLLRDSSGVILAALGVAVPRTDFLSFGNLLERSFWTIGSVIFLLVIVTGSVFTERITIPVEKLELATEEVRRGNLGFEVETPRSDEMGNLGRAFNTMTQQLRTRIAELQELSRGSRELSTSLERSQILLVAGRIFRELANPDGLIFVVVDEDHYHYRILGGFQDGRILHARSFDRTPGLLADGLEAGEPRVVGDVPLFVAGRTPALSDAEAELIRDCQRLVLLPFSSATSLSGLILLLYRKRDGAEENEFPPNLELLSTLSTHVASALENSHLYQHAIQDAETGFYVETYFRSRLNAEIDRCQGSDRVLSLVVLQLPDIRNLAQELGPSSSARFLRELGGAVRRHLRHMYLVGRPGKGELEILMPETSLEEAKRIATLLTDIIENRGISLGPGKPRVKTAATFGIACAPRDGSSASFIIEAATRRLEARTKGTTDPTPDQVQESTAAIEMEAQIRQMSESVCFRNHRCLEILETVTRIAPSSVTVLILGETGSGKEVIADLIHENSDRSDRPFVKINCSALPEPLLESELFGHEKGAFTGATRRKPGRFEVANGGTIFLDEIGDMSLTIQAKLLRVLQDKKIERVGGTTLLDMDVRILAATHKDLIGAIANQTFREDLYFRLNVVSLVLPPLRERKEEIPLLVHVFIQEFNEINGSSVTDLTPDALDKLHRHEWPGNVRELKNCIERAALHAGTGSILAEHITLLEQNRRREEVPPTGTSSPRQKLSGPPISAELESLGKEHDLNRRQLHTIELLRGQGSLTNSGYASQFSVSERTALRDLSDLVKKGVLSKHGKTRGTQYSLTPSVLSQVGKKRENG